MDDCWTIWNIRRLDQCFIFTDNEIYNDSSLHNVVLT